MHNIWDFFSFTISASLVGVFLLLVKALFHDKLTAKWHYVIWIVLFVRLIIPVENPLISSPLSLLGSFQFPEWMAFLQMKVETALQSIFSVPYGAVNYSMDTFLQWQNYSITDWLFVIYIAGVLLLTVYYTVVYLTLCIRIGRGLPAGEELNALVEGTAQRFHVKSCRKVRICSGFDTPFVCGLVRPVLVIPAHMKDAVSETMVLHELLHLPYKDIVINFLIHGVRILNWCNPVMWFILNRVQNDSEAFCDQRVLERIEAEAHKAYGNELLDLAHSKYPNVVGTTAMANGKRNIKRRLKRIVDFSRVPSGHGAAAFCITLLLTLSCVANASVSEPDFKAEVNDGRSMEKMLMDAQLYRTQTPEEALNIFCKALEEGNMGYMALVVPPDEWAEYEAWVWDIGRTGEDTYTALLGERAFADGERPITNDDGTYAYNFRDYSITNPYFFFEDGEEQGNIYRPIERHNIDDLIIQNLYQTDENTYRCQAIWDWHYDNENLESVWFDLAVEKTNDWNIRILDAQRVKTADELKGIPDELQSFEPGINRWPVRSVQSHEDENYAIVMQQYSYGYFSNLSWRYNWDPFGTDGDKPAFQRELDFVYQDDLTKLKFKQPVDCITQFQVLMLPADDDYEAVFVDIEENEAKNENLMGHDLKDYASGSNQGWHYKTFPVSKGAIPPDVVMGGGTDYLTPELFNKPYRVLIFENGELTANIVLEQEAMLYDKSSV